MGTTFLSSRSKPASVIPAAPSSSAAKTALSPSVNPPKLYMPSKGRLWVVRTRGPSNRGIQLFISGTLSPCAWTTMIVPARFISRKVSSQPSRSVETISGRIPFLNSLSAAASAAKITSSALLLSSAPSPLRIRLPSLRSSESEGALPHTVTFLPLIAAVKAAISSLSVSERARTAASSSPVLSNPKKSRIFW